MGTVRLKSPLPVTPPPPSPIKGVEIRCPNCHNLYGVIAATMGVAEFKCTHRKCKDGPSGGVFTVTVVCVPQAVTIISDLVSRDLMDRGDLPVKTGGAMLCLTKPKSSTIIRR